MVFLLGLFCALLAGELALRTGGFVLRIMQERNNRVSLRRGGYRIMCLGESTTAGGKEAWPALLEKRLSALYPGLRFSVVNKGVAGVNTTQLMQALEKNLDEVRPDMVITMMGMNDSFIRYYEGVSTAENPFFQHFRLYKWLMIALNLNRTAQPRTMPAPPQESRAAGPVDPYTPFQDKSLDIAKSEAGLVKRLERDPDDTYALYVLGRYWSLENLRSEPRPGLAGKGEALLLRAAHLSPKDGFVFSALGIHYTLSDDFRRGILMLEKAAELNPSAENWNNLGRVYMDRNMPDKAEAALLKTINFRQLSAEREEGLLDLCCLDMKLNNFSKAEALLLKALAYNPDNEKINGALSRLYAESGRPDLARRYDGNLARTRAMFTETTRAHFKELRRILKARGIRLACMQYPMCPLAPLRTLEEDSGDIIFIDNERAFKKAVAEKGYLFYFRDMFAGNFGHCTKEGHDLIARDAADTLAGYFDSLAGK